MIKTRPREYAGVTVKEKIVDKKTVYQVIMPDGSVANNYNHPDKRIAEKHKQLIEAFLK